MGETTFEPPRVLVRDIGVSPRFWSNRQAPFDLDVVADGGKQVPVKEQDRS